MHEPIPIPRLRTALKMCRSGKLLPYSRRKETTSRTSNLRLRRRNQNQPNNLPHRSLRFQNPIQARPFPRPFLRIRTNTLSTLGHCSRLFFGCYRNTTSTRPAQSKGLAFAECSPRETSLLTWVSPLAPQVPSRKSMVWMNIRPDRHRNRRRLNHPWMGLQSGGL